MQIKSLLVAAGLAFATALAGCSTDGISGITGVSFASYAARTDAGYRVPAIPITKVAQKYRRQTVNYQTNEKPGTIVVDTSQKYLYFVMPGGKAMRYGIGVGKEGFEWKGTARIGAKREWPVWTPPPAMIKRRPDLAKWRGGMPGGPQNALGARAMYLYNKGGDSWLPPARHAGMVVDRQGDVVGLHPHDEPGRDRPLQPRQCRSESHRQIDDKHYPRTVSATWVKSQTENRVGGPVFCCLPPRQAVNRVWRDIVVGREDCGRRVRQGGIRKARWSGGPRRHRRRWPDSDSGTGLKGSE